MFQNKNEVFKNLPNPSRTICNNLIGPEHKLYHRVIIGVLIMFFGVMLTKLAVFANSIFIEIFADAVGYLLHGIGAVPIVEYFISLNNQKDE